MSGKFRKHEKISGRDDGSCGEQEMGIISNYALDYRLPTQPNLCYRKVIKSFFFFCSPFWSL